MIINAIVIGVLFMIAGGILWYLLRARKKGQSCIGCPYCKQCNGSCSGGDRQENRQE